MHVERALVLRIRSFQWPQSTSLCPLHFLSHLTRLGSHSPLLPLPVHPPSGTHWLVSRVLYRPRPLLSWNGIAVKDFLCLGVPSEPRAPNWVPPHTPRTAQLFWLPAHSNLHFYRLISLSVTTPTDCQALFAFIQWAGNTTIGASTSLLLVRTVAVWNRSPYVIAPMLLLSAGQWGLLYYSQFPSPVPPIRPTQRHSLFFNFRL